MRRYELVGKCQITLNHDAPTLRPGDGEVLIRIGACTICNRSDLVYYHYLGERQHCATGCFGHEIAGTVAAVGPGVSRFGMGERVFVRTPLTSGFADFALARQVSVGRLPEMIPFEQGAILQLLPLAVHATRGVRLGDRVAIVGQGPVGLMATQVVRLRGAIEIAVADLDPWRLERSVTLGVTSAVQANGTASDLRRLGADFDVAIEAVGTPDTANACIELVRPNGLVVFLGTHHVDTTVAFDLVTWERKGLRIHTAAEPTDTDRAAAMTVAERLVATGHIETASLLSAVLPLTELPSALKRLSASRILYPADTASPSHTGPPPATLKIAIRP